MEQRRSSGKSHWYHETQSSTLEYDVQPLVPGAAKVSDPFLLESFIRHAAYLEGSRSEKRDACVALESKRCSEASARSVTGGDSKVSDFCVHGYLSGFIGFCPRTGLSVPVSDLRL